MNKLLNTLVALLTFTFLFTACSKSPDKILDRKDGKWDVLITTVLLSPSYGEVTSQQSGTFLFEGNKYTLTLSNGQTAVGSWTADAQKVHLITDVEVVAFDVIKSKRKEQEWHTTGTFQNRDTKYEVTYKLKR